MMEFLELILDLIIKYELIAILVISLVIILYHRFFHGTNDTDDKIKTHRKENKKLIIIIILILIPSYFFYYFIYRNDLSSCKNYEENVQKIKNELIRLNQKNVKTEADLDSIQFIIEIELPKYEKKRDSVCKLN
jgi:hypothetical protein